MTERVAARTQRDVGRLARLLLVVVVVAIVWIAREVLIPISLAVLFAFVLLPIAMWIERRGLARWLASVVAMTLATLLLLACGWVVLTQVIGFAEVLPQYRTRIREKLMTLSGETDSWLSRARRSVTEVHRQVEEAAATLSGEGEKESGSSEPRAHALSRDRIDAAPMDVIVHEPLSPTRRLAQTVGAVTAPLVGGVIVLLFATVILIRRDDLRDRILALVGPERVHTTTDLLDEAAAQLSRLLLAQLLVNIGFAIAFGAVLIALGVPNAILFGAIAIVLRFVPVVGAWIVLAIPFVVALLTSEGWFAPAVIVASFAVLEVVTAYIVEPWALGRGTGMSMTAVLLALVFWTWLWGPVGLVLAMPLTTSLAVMGRRFPAMAWLGKVLNEDPGLPAPTRVYQRLIALDFDSALALARSAAESRGLEASFAELLVPALTRLAQDRSVGELPEDRARFVMNGIGEIVDLLAEDWIVMNPPPARSPSFEVVCVPARGSLDELTARIVSRALQCRGIASSAVSSDPLLAERLASAVEADASVICICASPPLAERGARVAAARLQGFERHGERRKRVVIALFHLRDPQAAARLRGHPGIDSVTTGFDETMRVLGQ